MQNGRCEIQINGDSSEIQVKSAVIGHRRCGEAFGITMYVLIARSKPSMHQQFFASRFSNAVLCNYCFLPMPKSRVYVSLSHLRIHNLRYASRRDAHFSFFGTTLLGIAFAFANLQCLVSVGWSRARIPTRRQNIACTRRMMMSAVVATAAAAAANSTAREQYMCNIYTNTLRL